MMKYNGYVSVLNFSASRITGMELNVIRESFERVVKRRSSSSQELIDQISHEIEQALLSIESANDPTTVLTKLKAKLQALGSHNHLKGPHQEVKMIFSQHEENLEKMLFPNISNQWRTVEFDHHSVNQIIISHFYRKGLFDVADCLIKEAREREPEPNSLRGQFQKIHSVVNALKAKDIDPAVAWITENRGILQESYSDLELKLNNVHFIDNLQDESTDVALACNKNCSKTIYLENLANKLFRAFCTLNRQPYKDPLEVSVAAGAEVLPTLLRPMDKIVVDEEFAVVVEELGKEFQFHSIFVCPVTYEQSSQENPAMMLPCGHCLCKKTIDRMPNVNYNNNDNNNEEKIIKCPFCHMKASVSRCSQLYY